MDIADGSMSRQAIACRYEGDRESRRSVVQVVESCEEGSMIHGDYSLSSG